MLRLPSVLPTASRPALPQSRARKPQLMPLCGDGGSTRSTLPSRRQTEALAPRPLADATARRSPAAFQASALVTFGTVAAVVQVAGRSRGASRDQIRTSWRAPTASVLLSAAQASARMEE